MANEILDTNRITSVQGGILALCFFCMMLDGFDILIISFTAPAISEELAIAPEQLGLVFSAALLGMAVGAMSLASLADVYGRRLVISGALLLSGVATLAVYYLDTVTQLMALRFIAGLGLGTIVAVIPGFGGEYSPLKNRSVILSILVAGVAIGSVIGGVISAWAIPLFGWRSLYLCGGLVITFTAILFFLVVPESIQYLLVRKRHVALDRINRTLRYIRQPSIAQLPPSDSRATESATVKSLLTPARRKTTLLAWLAFFMAFAGTYFMNSWLPKLLVEAGMSSQASIQAVVILNFGAITGTIGVGLLSRWRPLKILIVASFMIATALMLLLSLIVRQAGDDIVGVVWALSFVIGITLHGAFGNIYTVVLSLYPAHIRITGLGWCVGLGRGGAIISPAVTGLLLGLGMSSANMLGLFAIIAGMGAVFLGLMNTEEMA